LYIYDLPGTFNELQGELKTWNILWKEKPVNELSSSALETLSSPFINFYPNIKRI